MHKESAAGSEREVKVRKRRRMAMTITCGTCSTCALICNGLDVDNGTTLILEHEYVVVLEIKTALYKCEREIVPGLRLGMGH